jgi:hypothetical protein
MIPISPLQKKENWEHELISIDHFCRHQHCFLAIIFYLRMCDLTMFQNFKKTKQLPAFTTFNKWYSGTTHILAWPSKGHMFLVDLEMSNINQNNFNIFLCNLKILINNDIVISNLVDCLLNISSFFLINDRIFHLQNIIYSFCLLVPNKNKEWNDVLEEWNDKLTQKFLEIGDNGRALCEPFLVYWLNLSKDDPTIQTSLKELMTIFDNFHENWTLILLDIFGRIEQFYKCAINILIHILQNIHITRDSIIHLVRVFKAFDKFINNKLPSEDRKGKLIAKFLDFSANKDGTEEELRDLSQRDMCDVLTDIRDSLEKYDAIKKLLSNWVLS